MQGGACGAGHRSEGGSGSSWAGGVTKQCILANAGPGRCKGLRSLDHPRKPGVFACQGRGKPEEVWARGGGRQLRLECLEWAGKSTALSGPPTLPLAGVPLSGQQGEVQAAWAPSGPTGATLPWPPLGGGRTSPSLSKWQLGEGAATAGAHALPSPGKKVTGEMARGGQ